MLGQAGEAVPVTVQGPEEGLGEHSLQLDCIESPLVLPLSLEGVQLWAEMLLLIQVLQPAVLLIISVQFVDIVLGLSDIVLGPPS